MTCVYSAGRRVTFFHVGNAQALAIRLVGTFVLVGGGRTAPHLLASIGPSAAEYLQEVFVQYF